MDNKEKLEFMNRASAFIEKNQIYDLFESLNTALLLNRPQDPLTFLIEKLNKPLNFRIFFSLTPNIQFNYEIFNVIAREFNYKLISEKDILEKERKTNEKIDLALKNLMLVDDIIINKLVLNEIISAEKSHKGVIVLGYPRNLVKIIILLIKF